LQSGSDSVLRRMRRRWSTKTFLQRCRLLREALPQPAITTDIITGFPGETEEEFQQTLSTCRAAGFSKIHAFPFSARKGTPAAEMADQVPKSIRSERVAALGELETELRSAYFRSLIGQPLQLLIESNSRADTDGKLTRSVLRGTTCRYAPAELQVDTPHSLHEGDLVDVVATETDGEKLQVTVAAGR